MKAAILFLSALFSCAAIAAGCGDDGTSSTSTASSGTGGDTAAPQVPAIGTQIERMGRPAINTAANNTFNPDEATKGAAKDAYNQAGQSSWSGFRDEIANNLGILDSLDATCGNQFLAGPMATADRYDTLAGVLADDRLWVNLSSDTCATYLAVEANAVMALVNNDCGGRRLTDDVIQTSYSLLAAGLFSGVDDTINADPAKTGNETFPYLANPQ